MDLGGHLVLGLFGGLWLLPEASASPLHIILPAPPNQALHSPWGSSISQEGETKAETNLSKSTQRVSSRVRTKRQVSFLF